MRIGDGPPVKLRRSWVGFKRIPEIILKTLILVVLLGGWLWLVVAFWPRSGWILGVCLVLWLLSICAAKMATGSSAGCAFVDELGKWPKVTHAGDGYLIKASFSSPRRARWPTWLGVVTGIVLFFWASDNLDTLWPGDDDKVLGRIMGVLIGCMIAGWASRFVWSPLCRVRLKIKIKDGGASWIGPKSKRCRILPGQPYLPGWTAHRLGGRAQRILQEKLRRGKISQGEKIKPTYEEASEVVFRTGPGWNIEWPVAEIAGDVTGQRALSLQVALDLALTGNRKAMDEAEARRKAGAGAGGTADLDRE